MSVEVSLRHRSAIIRRHHGASIVNCSSTLRMPMMRPSTYTCRRCLDSLSSAVKPVLQRPVSKRWISGFGKQRTASTPISTTRKDSKICHTEGTRRQLSSQESKQAASSSAELREQPTEPYVTSLGHASSDSDRVLLREDNLFHSFTNSPSPAIRRRAAFMRQNAYCPHPSHQRNRQPTAPDDPENRKPVADAANVASPPAHVKFECPDCGIPVSCCEEHWADDYESHLEVCDTLRQINEDDHDLRSGRFFPEFDYPGTQRAEEFVLNMSNWDTLLYTRDFKAINEPRNMRQVTRLLTYPITVASVLHELSPYNIRKGHRLTNEGLRSFSALRYSLHPPRSGENNTMEGLRARPPPIRLFVLGARAESSLPREVWAQLAHCFPRSTFHIIFIGPESMADRESEFPLPERSPTNPFGAVVEARISSSLKISTYVDYFHTMHEAGHFAPYDPYFDVFVLFHPGLGHPASSHEWKETLPKLLETKCPIISTGYTEWDLERDRKWVEEQAAGEMDVLLEPGENIFRSLRWDLNDLDPGDVTCGNWGVMAFRGKRYETTANEE